MTGISLVYFRREEVFVYLDGGNCDWFQFQKVFIDTQTKTPRHVTERAIPLNSQLPKVNTTATSFFLQWYTTSEINCYSA